MDLLLFTNMIVENAAVWKRAALTGRARPLVPPRQPAETGTRR
ncbi:hypothetical protein [Solimonas terrae]|nr:hypothetical protein [Solimonas terrae]